MIPADDCRAATARFAFGSGARGGIEHESGGGIGRTVRALLHSDDRVRITQQQAARLAREFGGGVGEDGPGKFGENCDVHVIRG